MPEVEFGAAKKVSEPKAFASKKRKKVRGISKTVKDSGDEPLYAVPLVNNSLVCPPEIAAMAKVFNWYSANKDSKDSVNYIIEYLTETKADKAKIRAIKHSSAYVMSTSSGWVARQITLGAKLPKTVVAKLKSDIELAVADGEAAIKAAKTNKVRKVSIQESIQKLVDVVIGNLDGEIDSFITNKFKSDFSFKEKYGNRLKPIHLSKVATYLKSYKAEWEEALAGKDEQLVEAYEIFTKGKKKKVINFLDDLLNEIGESSVASKKIRKQIRKPRAKKAKSPHDIVKKVKYLKEHTELDLKSLSPHKIVGADQVWVYNTKYRKLSQYKADSAQGLSVKGTTIIHFSDTESQEKKLRKPEVIIPKVLDSGKVGLRRLLDGIRCKAKVPKGRLNEFSIIVRVL